MKRTLFTIVLLMGYFASNGQPNITNLSYPSTVNLFDMYEITFNMDSYSNPYDPDVIDVYAVFTAPNNVKDTVIGFYYEGYSFSQNSTGFEIASSIPTSIGWRIRFTPDVVGMWSFSIHAIDQQGETVIPSQQYFHYLFDCQSVSSAQGFISKANTRYLKREVVENGRKRYRSFFPVGPNIAWYSSYYHGDSVKGIYEYEKYIDSLDGNGNYMRIWLNRYQSLNLYGPEYAHKVNGNTVVYFDSLVNQKDSSELDHIISYASQHDVSLMLCIFSYGDFNSYNPQDSQDSSIWENNPFNFLSSPCQFFSNQRAQRITKNLIRYIVARWGYATNIMSWEFWNELTNMNCYDNSIEDSVIIWHKEMENYLRSIDPFNHCISTSMILADVYPYLYSNLFTNLDFVQQHNYQNINKAKSKEQFSNILYKLGKQAHVDYSTKPYFIGEFGFGQGDKYNSKDPYGVDLHNSLWSSLFSSSMGPASFWWWNYLKTRELFPYFKPIHTFCQNLPILSDSFQAFSTGRDSAYMLLFPNNIETYYMKNLSEDTIYGWCQDTAFCYQSLRWLTDSVIPLGQTNALHFVDSVVFDPNGYVYTLLLPKRPAPSSNNNAIRIPITNKPVGARYALKWFDSETGMQYNFSAYSVTVQQDAEGKYLSFSFPASIRNLRNQVINNTFGDAVFALYYSGGGGINQKNR